MGRENYIKVTENRIEIFFFNIINGHVSIDVDKILKISTSETYEMETALDLESTFYLFSREYNLDYMDGEKKKRLTTFKINNRKKEIEIVNAISRIKEKI